MRSPSTDSAPLPSSLVPESLERPGNDPIFALLAEAVARQQKGEDILNATLGALAGDDGKLSVLPTVTDALRALPPAEFAAYAPIAGLPEFLDGVRTDLFEDHPLREQAIAVATPGGTGALYAALVNFLDRGELLLTTSYYWEPYGILADHSGRGLETFRSFNDQGRLDLEDFERQLNGQLARQDRAMVLLNTPCHNPTGYSLDDEEWSGVADIVVAAARRKPVTLLLDHAYARFAGADTADWRPHTAKIAEAAQVLVAWTASKSFTLYGARVGAAVAIHAEQAERTRLASALSYTARGTWSNGNRAVQRAVANILADDKLRASCEAERGQLVEGLTARVERFKDLAAEAGLRHPRYEGGFFVCVFSDDPKAAAAKMREAGVFVVPIQGALRVALCSTPIDSIPRLIGALSDAGCS